MTTKYFTFANETKAGDNWLIAWAGADRDGHSYGVTTDHIHASEVGDFTRGARGDAELIAALLNWYYNLDEGEQRHVDKTLGLEVTE